MASAVQVGSYFVGQYYQVLKEQPDLAHQFYNESSSMIRVEGETSESASSMLHIHGLLMSLNLTTIEVKTINCLESSRGGILVVVSGLVKTEGFNSRRKFTQTFFLAPQETGYFVLNDIFQFSDEDSIYQHPPTIVADDKANMQFNTSNPAQEPVSNYVFEEEAREYINSANREDNPVEGWGQDSQVDNYDQYNPVEEYNVPEPNHFDEAEHETAWENSYAEDVTVSMQNLHMVSPDAVEEPTEEPAKKTYASILGVAKGQGQLLSAVSSQPTYKKAAPETSDWSYTAQPTAQQTNAATNWEPESVTEAADSGFIDDEGLLKSVYVRNLPSTVTEDEIADVFKHFGKIIPDGVAIKLRKEVGICYAFVEFEDFVGVHNAVKTSPVQLAGRQVYIEERRANATGGSRGGRRGRGRGSYTTETGRGSYGSQRSGRGSSSSNYDGSDYSRSRGGNNGSYSSR